MRSVYKKLDVATSRDLEGVVSADLERDRASPDPRKGGTIGGFAAGRLLALNAVKFSRGSMRMATGGVFG
jgi:hypothetical protein